MDPKCGSRRAGAAEPRWRSRPDGRAGAVRPAAMPSGGAGASGGSATDERQACYAAPGRENDAWGRFTNRRPGDSRRGFRRSAGAVASCGLAARPPVAGRAASAVAGATPLARGSVRRSGECVFTTRPSASRGRSRTIDPSGKGARSVSRWTLAHWSGPGGGRRPATARRSRRTVRPGGAKDVKTSRARSRRDAEGDSEWNPQ